MFTIDIISNSALIIPEYKIDLLSKTKKILNTIENIHKLPELKKIKKVMVRGKKESKKELKKDKKELKKDKKEIKKSKTKKILRTLWVRRKKN